MKKARLVRLSICPCGFPLLHDSIPLGTEYQVNPDDRTFIDFRCGGCESWSTVDAMMVLSHSHPQRWGYLPADAFEIQPEEEHGSDTH